MIASFVHTENCIALIKPLENWWMCQQSCCFKTRFDEYYCQAFGILTNVFLLALSLMNTKDKEILWITPHWHPEHGSLWENKLSRHKKGKCKII